MAKHTQIPATLHATPDGYYGFTLHAANGKRSKTCGGFGTLEKAATYVRDVLGAPVADTYLIRRCDGNRNAFALVNVARRPDAYGYCVLTHTQIGPLVAAAASGTKAASMTIDLDGVRERGI